MSALRIIVVPEKTPVGAPEEAIFSAVCLEHFVVAQGNSIEDALLAFDKLCCTAACIAEADNELPFTGIAAAPSMFHEMYKAGKAKGFVVPMPSRDRVCHISAVVHQKANAA